MFKKYFINWIVKNLFVGLTVNDVIKFDGAGGLYLAGEKIIPEVADKYRDEALKALNSRILQDIDKAIVFETNKLMFEKSKTSDDMMFGKAMLHTIELRKKYLEKLSKLR